MNPAKKPTKKPAKQPARKPTRKPAPRSGFPVFWVAIGAIVAIGVVIAIVSTGGDTTSSGNGGGNATAHEYGTVTVTGTPLTQFADSGSDPAVGSTIPTVKGENFAGDPVTIAPDGTPQMIVFLAHWCPHCNVEAPKLAAYLRSVGGAPKGVHLTIVPTGSRQDSVNWPPSQWVKTMKLGAVTALVDDQKSTAAAAFGLTSYPYIVMVDKDGAVVDRRAGEQQDGFFAKAFGALAAGTPVPASA